MYSITDFCKNVKEGKREGIDRCFELYSSRCKNAKHSFCYALCSFAIASKNTYPTKQRASVLHGSHCNAIARLRSCKSTNVVKKTKASPCGDAFAFLAEKERFELSRRDNRPTPLAGAPLRPLEYFSVYSLQAAVCSRLQQRLLYTIFILLSTPFSSFFQSFFFFLLLTYAR